MGFSFFFNVGEGYRVSLCYLMAGPSLLTNEIVEKGDKSTLLSCVRELFIKSLSATT